MAQCSFSMQATVDTDDSSTDCPPSLLYEPEESMQKPPKITKEMFILRKWNDIVNWSKEDLHQKSYEEICEVGMKNNFSRREIKWTILLLKGQTESSRRTRKGKKQRDRIHRQLES